MTFSLVEAAVLLVWVLNVGCDWFGIVAFVWFFSLAMTLRTTMAMYAGSIVLFIVLAMFSSLDRWISPSFSINDSGDGPSRGSLFVLGDFASVSAIACQKHFVAFSCAVRVQHDQRRSVCSVVDTNRLNNQHAASFQAFVLGCGVSRSEYKGRLHLFFKPLAIRRSCCIDVRG